MTEKKKLHNLKVENYVLFGGLAEDLSPGDSLSDSSEGLLQRGKVGVKIYRGFCNKNQVVGTSKDYYFLKNLFNLFIFGCVGSSLLRTGFL